MHLGGSRSRLANCLQVDSSQPKRIREDGVSICPSCPGSIHDDHHAAQTEDHSYRVIAIRLNSVDTPAQ